MERLVDEGLVRDIGVSNFRRSDILQLLAGCRIRPCVNQIEHHPQLRQQELVQFCKTEGITIVSYSPMSAVTTPSEGGARVMAVAERIALERGITASQVLLCYSLHFGAVVTTSSQVERLQKALDCQSIALLPDDILALEDAAGAEERFHWCKITDWN
jgi:diketogulonate reductase-like aldo/keto reductase